MSTASPFHRDASLPTATSQDSKGRQESAGRLSRLARMAAGNVPNILVFSLLGGVFLLGHETGWKLPSLSSLLGSAAETPVAWCDEHLVPEELCVECQDGLLAKAPAFGFCRTHGVAECVICHPELAQVRSEPNLPKYDTAQALAVIDRPTNNSRNTLHERRVQFASAAAATKAGVQVNVVQEQPMTEAITANGEIQFDPTRVAHLSARAPGTVAQVFKIMGDEVHAGDVLALLDVAAVGQAKSELLQAIVNRQLRQSHLDRVEAAGIGVAGAVRTESKAALSEAEVRLISARQALVNLGLEVPEDLSEEDPRKTSDDLRFLGIPQATLQSLPPGTRSANLYAVRAPHDGVVVSSDSVVGEVVSTGQVLYTVADPSRMWLTLAVPREDARYLKPALPVDFNTDDGARQVSGTIAWVSPAIDPRTRTVQARVILDNADGKLKDKTFGSGKIVLRQEKQAIVVPSEAVQATSDATFVFVRDKNYLQDDAPKVFHVRQVRTGAKEGNQIELLAGVLPGEVIATEGSNVLLSQLLRSNLGAGCGCHEVAKK